MTRFPKKNRVSTLEAIPHELITEILSQVAASSIVDIHNIKLSCKNLNEVAEDGHVYKHANLDNFPVGPWTPRTQKQQDFLNKCRKSDNPELLYIDALIDYFNREKTTAACEKLDKALKLGHQGAMYAMSIVLLFSSNDELRRKGVKLIGEMKKTGSSNRKLRLCREKLCDELRKMWVKNPVLKEQPKYCTELHRNRVWWSDEGDDCEACAADNEVRVISSTYHIV